MDHLVESDVTHVTHAARLTLRAIPDVQPIFWQLVEDAHPDATPGKMFRLFQMKLPLRNGGEQCMTYMTERVEERTMHGNWRHHVYVDSIPPPPRSPPKYPVHACM